MTSPEPKPSFNTLAECEHEIKDGRCAHCGRREIWIIHENSKREIVRFKAALAAAEAKLAEVTKERDDHKTSVEFLREVITDVREKRRAAEGREAELRNLLASNEPAPNQPFGKLFHEWWDTRGRFLDPDTDDVPWFDKREALAAKAFSDALQLAAPAGPGQPAGDRAAGAVGEKP